MLSRSNGVTWVDDTGEQDDGVSWTRPPQQPSQPPLDGGDWYLNGGHIITPSPQLSSGIGNDNLLLPSTLQTALSCSSQPQFDPFAKSSLSSFLSNNPFEATAFNFPSEPSFLPPVNHSEPGPSFELPGFGYPGLESLDPNPAFFGNRVKMLMPLEVGPTIGPPPVEPSLFQKRAMVRSYSTGSDKLGELGGGFWGGRGKRKRDNSNGDGDFEEDEVEGSFGVSMVNYDSDEQFEEGDGGNNFTMNNDNSINDGDTGNFSNSNTNSMVTGGGVAGGEKGKGKRKGLPAKNLMAERRRRKKLNDRLYLLRSVVPKISKVCFCLANFILLGSYTLVCV